MLYYHDDDDHGSGTRRALNGLPTGNHFKDLPTIYKFGKQISMEGAGPADAAAMVGSPSSSLPA